jgi:glutathione S-transferase
MSLTLTGYALSVYTRSARMALVVRGLGHDYVECDPFEPSGKAALADLHPFGRVPVLDHDGFRLFETQAILDYIDCLGEAAPLTPQAPRARARMRQVIGITDSYVYWPLIRQAVTHAIFLTEEDTSAERAQTIIAASLVRAPPVLDVLEEIADEGLALSPGQMTLADCHLWPMMDYLRMIPEAAQSLALRPALSRWAEAMQAHPSATATRPDLTLLKGDST